MFCVIGLIFFPLYVEVMIAGVLLDVLFGVHGTGIMSFPIVHSMIAIVIYGVSAFIRTRVR